MEYDKKLLLIGIIPACQSNVVGAAIAMLPVNVYLAMLLKMEPYANQLDNFLAVCLNALLSHSNISFSIVENGCRTFAGGDERWF